MRKHITDPVSKHKVLTSILSISVPVHSEAVMNTMVWADTQKSEEPQVGFSGCTGWGPALISLHDPSTVVPHYPWFCCPRFQLPRINPGPKILNGKFQK